MGTRVCSSSLVARRLFEVPVWYVSPPLEAVYKHGASWYFPYMYFVIEG